MAGRFDEQWQRTDRLLAQGGGKFTTYFYNSTMYAVSPAVYDGVQNALPFLVTNGPSLTFKTTPDTYVNVNGINISAPVVTSGTLSATGAGNNYFAGNVSIATPPSGNYLLAVNGSAIFTQAVVKLNANWPDYVFNDGYSFPPLDSVAKYIRVNGRLPEMPSSDSVRKNGLDLGDNQAALLKKIEELTLYVIDLQKQVAALQKEVTKHQ